MVSVLSPLNDAVPVIPFQTRLGWNIVENMIAMMIAPTIPLKVTTSRPTRRRRESVAEVSARLMGLVNGGRLFRIVAALYSRSRSRVVRLAQSGQVAQCCITAESG
jgi:hypothetical protein